jgi:hypothetical protein
VPGKTTYIPLSGHTDKSYSIEEWYADIARSEVFSGCKFTKASVQLPPTGMATLDLTVAGKDHGQTPGSTRYFTSPTSATSSGVVAAVNGVFIGASNELGEFESGLTAALWGPVASVVAGGVGTVLIAVSWLKLFPALARRDKL